MIYPQTILTVADNSGAKKIMCIRILGGNKKYGKIAEKIIGVVVAGTKEDTTAYPRPTRSVPVVLKRSDIVKAVIVRTKQRITRSDGLSLKFDDNAAVIINEGNNPRGTRIFGPVAREIRDKNFLKIASLASEVL